MTLGGYWSVEFEIYSPANEFCQGYMEIAKPPNGKASVKELEVDLKGKRKTQLRFEGFHISEWLRTLAKPLTNITKDEAKSQDPHYYYKLVGSMTVVHTEGNNGGRATWTIEYEKISDDIKDTKFIIEITADYFKEMDSKIFSKLLELKRVK